MNVLLKSSLLATAVMIAGLSSAHADADDSAQFDVTIEITAACNIAATAPTAMDFGQVASDVVGPTLMQSELSVTCTDGSVYWIALGAGTSTTREMAHSNPAVTDVVPYELWQDAGRTVAWTDIALYTGTGTGAEQKVPVYGRVTAHNVTAGVYTDRVTATVTY